MRVTIISPQTDGASGLYDYSSHLCDNLDDSVVGGIEIETYEEGSINPIKYFSAIYSSIKADPDIVHVQHEYGLFGPVSVMSWLFFPVLFVACRILGIQTVVTIHEVINENHMKKPFSTLKGIYINCMNHLIGLSADQLVFLSEQSQQQFSQFIHSTPDQLIPHGTIEEQQSSESSDTAKEKLGYSPDTFLIVEPGYVSERKGSDLFADIAGELPKYEFLLAGGAENGYGEFLDQISIESPENLRISGELPEDEFHSVFKAADLAVLPYREKTDQGFRNEVKQSGIFNWCVTYELPAIATNCRYFERMETEYHCVRTFEKENTEEGANTIQTVAESEEAISSLQDGLQRFKQDHSMEVVCKEHIDVYRQLQ